MDDNMKVNLDIDREQFAAYRDCVAAKNRVIDGLATENRKLKEAIHGFVNRYYEGRDNFLDYDKFLETETDKLLKLAPISPNLAN